MSIVIAMGADEVKSAQAEAFIRVLAVAVAWMHDENISQAMTHLAKHKDQAIAFATQYKLKPKNLTKLYTVMNANKTRVYSDLATDPIWLITNAIRPKYHTLVSPAEDIDRKYYPLLRDLYIMFKDDEVDENYLLKFSKDIRVLKDSKLTAMFMHGLEEPTSGSQKKLIAQIQKLYTAFTGETGTFLNPAQRKTAKAKSPAKFAKYEDLRKEILAQYKNAMQYLVRSSGERLVKIEDYRKYIKSAGIQAKLFPGFVGKIDEDGKLYTMADRLINGIPPDGKITMNPAYDPKEDNTYVYIAEIPWNDKPQPAWTVAFKSATTGDKWETVEEFSKVYDTVRSGWLKLMKSRNTQHKILSIMCEVLNLLQPRIGTKGNKTIDKVTGKEVLTYGLTTWLVGHVKPVVGGIQIAYQGKDNISQKHVLKSSAGPEQKAIVDYLLKLTKGRAKKEPLWQYETATGRTSVVKAHLLNAFLSELGAPSTAHKFRHVAGTRVATEGFAKAPKKFKDDKAAVDYFKKIMESVGKVLGHASGEKVAWTTAKDNYVSVPLMMDFFKSRGLAVPPFLHNKFNREESSY